MPITTPDWVKHAIFYQIFPDRFAKASNVCNGLAASTAIEQWDSPPTKHGYKGGNLQGIIERLDYLEKLGVNALYFNPIFDSPTNHRYHTRDYFQIDPLLGDTNTFKALLTKAHSRGIRVILDGVFNHTSRSFYCFSNILENGPESPWIDWHKIFQWPVSPYDERMPANYDCWKGNRALPRLNHENPATREYIMRVAEYWINVGIDGWRLDVPDCITASRFWEEFRDRVKHINADAYIVGEILNDATRWLDGKQFDGVVNYPFWFYTLQFIGGDKADLASIQSEAFADPVQLNASQYAERVDRLLNAYPWEIQLSQMNVLENHDTVRLLTVLRNDLARAQLAYLILFTFPGAPCIYYGGEIGLQGGHDPDCRRTFPLECKWNMDLLQVHKALINLRRTSVALRTGGFKVLFASAELFVFSRFSDIESIVVAINVGQEKCRVAIKQSFPQTHTGGTEWRPPAKVLYGVGRVEWEKERPGVINLVLPPLCGLVIG